MTVMGHDVNVVSSNHLSAQLSSVSQPISSQALYPALASYQYPCVGRAIQPEPLVLLHGWGCHSDIWQAVLPTLIQNFNVMTIDLPGFGQSSFFESVVDGQLTKIKSPSLDDYLACIFMALPERCSLVGWSLGGMLATALVSRYPKHFNALITLASNPCFTQRVDWPGAMPIQVFTAFSQLFQQQPTLCLNRFYRLQSQGDCREREVNKTLKYLFSQHPDVNPINKNTDSRHVGWLRGLTLLEEIDNRDAISSLRVPGLHLYGEADQLMPATVAAAVTALNHHQEVEILEQIAHVPQLSCPNYLAERIVNFLKHHRYRLDKHRVAQSFSRAASSYDSVARLQRHTGQKLLGSISSIFTQNMPPVRLVDLGCGTGYFTAKLSRQFSTNALVGVDFAEGMLRYAREKYRDIDVSWLCGDAESLPLTDNSVDLIFSNLTFQWCDKLPVLAAEIARVLKPGGQLAFTSLGAETLTELKQSWAEVDDYVHVNNFLTAAHWQHSFEQSGLVFQQFDVERSVLSYRDLRHLTDELRDLGAHNLNSGRNKGLTKPEQVRQLVRAYEKFRLEDGELPATWEVIYGVAIRHD